MLVISPGDNLTDSVLVYPTRTFLPGTRGKKMKCLHCIILFVGVMPGMCKPVKGGLSGEADEGAVGQAEMLFRSPTKTRH